MVDMEKFKELEIRFRLTQKATYEEVLKEMTLKAIDLSSSQDEKELKGMFKLIKWVGGWKDDYNDYIAKNK